MPVKPRPLSDQIRKAIATSGSSNYRIAKEIGVSQATMSRFVNGHNGVSMDVLDELGKVLGLEIVASKTKVKGKVNRGKRIK
jgi:plasmid maintenance system antidote protein VapI